MNIIREQLKQYLDCDSDLIPLHIWNKQTNRKGKIQQRGKTPLYGKWMSRDKNVAETLKLADKGYNVGYRLSTTDLIIDVDPRNFEEDDNALERLCEFLGVFDLSEIAPTVITGSGGYHYYMTKPADFDCKELLEQFKGIEFKTIGRQVVCAGSKHPNGNYYKWDTNGIELWEAPTVPKKLLKLLKREVQGKQAEAGVLSNYELEKLLNQLPITDYKDNDSWFRVLCGAHHGTNGGGIEEFLDWCMGDPDFEDDIHLIRLRWESLSNKTNAISVSTLYKEVLSYGGNTAVSSAEDDFADFAEPTNSNTGEEAEDGDEGFEEDEDIDFADITEEKSISKSYKPGLALRLANELSNVSEDEEITKAVRAAMQAGTIEQAKALTAIQKNTGLNKGTINQIIDTTKAQIAEDLGRILAEKTKQVKFRKGKGIVFSNSSQFWIYNGTHWTPINKQYVGKQITKVLDKMRQEIDIKVKENAIVTEALSIMERICATNKDVLRLTQKPYPVINCRNGELWIDEKGVGKLREHKPSSYLLQVIDVEYTPGAECPLFDKSIREIFGNFPDTEDMVRHFEEYIGYILHPDKRPAHWWLMKGPGGDGKSTLFKIISGILGEAVMPEELSRFEGGARGDKHAMAELPGKLLVYDDDLNKNTILPDGILKKLSEDGVSTANPKGEKGFQFQRVCSVAMLSNGYPKTKDISRGTRRRAMVIPFNRGFHEGNAILDLPDQIIKNELAGVMNRALQGLQRLRQRGKFQEPKSCQLAKAEWLNESNPVAFFISECLEQTNNTEDTISLGDCFMEFTEFCNNYSIQNRFTKQQFRSSMEDMGIYYGHGSANVRSFKGVKVKGAEQGDAVEEFSPILEDDDFDFDFKDS